MKARAAINFLLEEFSAKAGWIRGQKLEESHKRTQGYTADNTPALSQWTNDDHILDCAMYFKDSNIALVTQDKALALKAQINQVEVMDVLRLMKQLPVLQDSCAYLLELSVEPSSKRRKLSVVPENNKHLFTPAPLSLRTPRTPTAEHVTAPSMEARDLPAELWCKVCSHLPPSALLRVARVNRVFAAAVKSDDTWRTSIRRLFHDTRDVLVPRDQSARTWYTRWRRQTLTWE